MEGKIYKNGKHWLAEIPLLDIMSQGKTEDEAKRMLIDAIEALLDHDNINLRIYNGETKGQIGLVVGDEDQDIGPFLSFVLKRTREANGLTIKDVVKILGNKSLNSYAQYEQNRNPTWEQFRFLLRSISPKTTIQERVS